MYQLTPISMLQTQKLNVIFLVVLAFATTPLATAQDSIENPYESTPTTLYFHIFDTFNKFVINTQAMDAEFFDVGGNNFPTVVGSPLNQVYGSDFDLNTIYGYSTAGPVEYDFIENGRPRFHPERGIAADVLLDPNVQPVVYLYVDLRDFTGGGTPPQYLPSFTFRVTTQQGDDPGMGADLDAGRDILLGQETYTMADFDLSVNPYQAYCSTWGCVPEGHPGYTIGPLEDPPLPDEDVPIVEGNEQFSGQTDPDGNAILFPDDSGIIEVAIPLEILESVIPKIEAYNVRIDWYQEIAGFGPDEFAEPYFRLVTDAEHLPRMELAITNPVYLTFIHPQVAANTLLIHAGANSPWGTYDLDIENVELTVTGPSTPKNIKAVLSSNENVHGLHDADAQLTYLWDFRDEGASDGEYTITMKVRNDAGTAEAVGTAKFIIEGEVATGFDTDGNIVESTSNSGDVEAPGVGALGAIALLGVALTVARRRFDE
jgi:hypothetical protein